MPRNYSNDKPTFTEKLGFTAGSALVTIDVENETLRLGLHITVHPTGTPTVWDRFHVKLFDRRFNKSTTKYDSYAEFPIDTWEPVHPGGVTLRMSKREIDSVVELLKTYVAKLPA
jgi:hypothetical protein